MMPYIKEFEPLWGLWHVEKLIGEGSFGKVYRVSCEENGKKNTAAVKHIAIPVSQTQLSEAISEGLASDDESLQEYFEAIAKGVVSEISIMSDLQGCSNIVSYEDHMIIRRPVGIGYDIFIRMELLTGLNDILSTRQLTNQDVIKLGIDICTALEECAERNILHRDIKPSNIFVDSDGSYKLGDFGVARQLEHTTSGMSKKGTYVYMSPEVYRGESANLTADIYSLGIVMYRLLNGNRAPFLPVGSAKVLPGDSESALSRRMAGEPLPAPAFADEPLAQVILTAVQFDRRNRFKTPTEFKRALECVRDGEPFTRTIPVVSAPTDNHREKSSEESSSHRSYAEECTAAASGLSGGEREYTSCTVSASTYGSTYGNTQRSTYGNHDYKNITPPDYREPSASGRSSGGLITAIVVLAAVLLVCIAIISTTMCSGGQEENVADDSYVSVGSTTERTTPASEATHQEEAVFPHDRNYRVGDTFTLGVYDSESIEWVVINVESDRMLVLSKKIIDARIYNSADTLVTWETCELRSWLNSSFFNSAFTRQERSVIMSVRLSNSDNSSYGSDGGADTTDCVFCLSADEASRYLTAAERKALPARAAVNNGIFVCDGWVERELGQTPDDRVWRESSVGYSAWWLRTPGKNNYRVEVVYFEGEIYSPGEFTHNYLVGVRPAMYINLE